MPGEIEKIVSAEDFDSLYLLPDNSDFSIALHDILCNRYDKNPNSLNPVQLNLFLCMHIENACQADSILSFLQEWFPEYQQRVIEALKEIGANRSSDIIRKAIALLPDDNSWFYESSDQETEKQMDALDGEFSDYPDGSLSDIYREYAEQHRNEVKK